MKISQISTYSWFSANNSQISRIREQLDVAQRELSTGRHADVGLELGSKISTDVKLRSELSKIETRSDANAHLSSRLDATQEALTYLVSEAQSFVAELTTAIGNSLDSGRTVAITHAKSSLATLEDIGNTSFAGMYVFAGDNVSQPPFGDYFSDTTSSARLGVATAFFNEFGVSQTDPAVENLSDQDVEDFLGNAFSSLFEDPNWSTTWSSASDTEFKVEVSENEILNLSATAQGQAFRDLASGLTIIADLGIENMNEPAYEAATMAALEKVNASITGLVEMQSNLGLVQDKVETRTKYDSVRMTIVTSHINQLESVDSTEAANRLSTLLTQLETSYAATARIQRLSLMNFI
ncbi:MAG: flagellar hook-associated family protein [Hyphomicrobiaceae bacterium]